MAAIEARIIWLEEAAQRKRRVRLSTGRRKVLTDRAVLKGDREALLELSQHRPSALLASKEQGSAAVAAGLRADQ